MASSSLPNDSDILSAPYVDQYATVVLNADSSVDLDNYSVRNLTPQIKPNSQMGQWDGFSLSGDKQALANDSTDHNTFWNFRVIINGAPSLLATWDSSCQSTNWSPPNSHDKKSSTVVTANFVCYDSNNVNILVNTTPQKIDTCNLFTGTPPANRNDIQSYDYTMTTPNHSNPTVYIDVSRTNDVYHFACKYSWDKYNHN